MSRIKIDCFLMTMIICGLCLFAFPAIGIAENILWDFSKTGILAPGVQPDLTSNAAIIPTQDLSGNIVTLTIDLNASVIGGGGLWGNISEPIRANHNQVVIGEGVNTGPVFGANVLTNSVNPFDVFANYNQIDIGRNARVSGVNGGSIHANQFTDQIEASYNQIHISEGSTINSNVFGGWAYAASGNSAKSDFNILRITDSTVTREIRGGYAEIDNVNGKFASSSNNSIYLKNTTVGDFVYGGVTGGADNTQSINNTITLEGKTNIANSLAGGNATRGHVQTDTLTGNTLNIVLPQTGGITVGGTIANFETYNFVFAFDAPDDSIGLDVQGEVKIAPGYKDSIKSLDISGGGENLKLGTQFELIKSTDGIIITQGQFSQSTVSGHKGFSLIYDYDLDLSTNSLKARLNRITTNPQLEALGEAPAAGLAFVNQGLDFIADYGFGAAGTEVLGGQNLTEPCLHPFTSIKGGSSSYDNGGSLDLKGFSMVLGLGCGQKVKYGQLTLGGFIEGGKGHYKSENIFANAEPVWAKGDVDYHGLGLLARMDFNNNKSDHFYVESAGHLGRVKSDYRGSIKNDRRDINFDYSADYFGAEFGVGYNFNIFQNTFLDLYGKYLWNHVLGDRVTVLEDQLNFDQADSHRLRPGLRLSHRTDRGLTTYAGLAYEHELDGKLSGSSYGYKFTGPSHKGGTGIVEVGMAYKPEERPLVFSAALEGFGGQREGLAGILSLKINF